MRLTGTALDCYKYLEPLYYDYRKIKRQNRSGGKKIIVVNKANLTQNRVRIDKDPVSYACLKQNVIRYCIE